MGYNMDLAGHFTAKQGGKTTKKKGGYHGLENNPNNKRPRSVSLEEQLANKNSKQVLSPHAQEQRKHEAMQDKENAANHKRNEQAGNVLSIPNTPGKRAPSQVSMMRDEFDMEAGEAEYDDMVEDGLVIGGKKRRTRKRHGKGPECSKCVGNTIDRATLPKATPPTELPMAGPPYPVSNELKSWAHQYPNATVNEIHQTGKRVGGKKHRTRKRKSKKSQRKSKKYNRK